MKMMKAAKAMKAMKSMKSECTCAVLFFRQEGFVSAFSDHSARIAASTASNPLLMLSIISTPCTARALAHRPVSQR